MHATMTEFLEHMKLEGRFRTAEGYDVALRQYAQWLEGQGINPLRASTDHIRGFQRWLAEEYKTAKGQNLSRDTQHTRMSAVKSYYLFLERRGLITVNVARAVKLPKLGKRVTTKDYLSLQEATALLQTQFRHVQLYRPGSYRWAKEMLTLALFCLAVATGRRRTSLLSIKTQDLDFERSEIRIEREKGKAGRVLPVAAWAMEPAKEYADRARPVLDWHKDNPWLFVGERSPRLGEATFSGLLRLLQHTTVTENPDLEELAGKKLTPHSLRVSFATLLFKGGADIRTVNELMDHEHLSTTARYTPIPLEDLRRACRLAHPRA
jgi:site-specific recombinase XerD